MNSKKVIVIAEAGVNHNGDINIAKQLIDVAVAAKADYVKFQTFKSENLVSKFAEKADYQKSNTHNASDSQLIMLKKLELDKASHLELIKYCQEKKINFLSTAFDLDSIDLLNELNIELFKIPSGEITNLPYLRKIGSLGKTIVMSTGMASMSEIKDALDVLSQAGAKLNNICVLHCNTEYPTPMRDVNLKAMKAISEECNVSVGYSDHTLGIEVPIAAVALGASIIEKHFTLSRSMDGPDHAASLEPDELIDMIHAIRNIETALGNGVKCPSESEKKNITTSRKSIVASKNISKGEVFSIDNLTTKRPGNGISPMCWDKIIGEKATKNYHEDDAIDL